MWYNCTAGYLYKNCSVQSCHKTAFCNIAHVACTTNWRTTCQGTNNSLYLFICFYLQIEHHKLFPLFPLRSQPLFWNLHQLCNDRMVFSILHEVYENMWGLTVFYAGNQTTFSNCYGLISKSISCNLRSSNTTPPHSFCLSLTAVQKFESQNAMCHRKTSSMKKVGGMLVVFVSNFSDQAQRSAAAEIITCGQTKSESKKCSTTHCENQTAAQNKTFIPAVYIRRCGT